MEPLDKSAEEKPYHNQSYKGIKTTAHQMDEKKGNESLSIEQRATLTTSRSSENTHDASSKKTFRKRPGTTDKGKEYENYVVASLVLKMVADENIKNFNISSNDEAFGDFDDVVFQSEKLGQPVEKYALQLKHSNKSKALSLDRLTAKKGDFSLLKLFTSFQELGNSVSGYKLILMTNLQFDVSEGTEILVNADNVSFPIEIIKCGATPLLDTTKTTNTCYKFRIREDVNNTTKVSQLQEYKQFFDQFFLYSNQSNLDQLKSEIPKQLRELFSCETTVLEGVKDKYLNYISAWSLSEDEKYKLYKKKMQRIIALYLATPFIHPICFGPVTENAKILQQAISKFDVTVFDEQAIEKVKKIWGDVKNKLGDICELNKKRKKYRTTLENIEDISTLSEAKYTELLWLTNKCPLIVSGSPSVYEAINLCRDRKFVLIRADPVHDSLKKSSVFHKLSDLKVYDYVLKDLSLNFKCSLPGQEVNLKYLLQQSDYFHEIITTNELLEMLDHPYEIIAEREELPDHYISRHLSRNIIDFEYLNAADNESLIVISNVRTEYDRCNLQKFDPINVDDDDDDDEDNKKRRNLYIKKDVCSEDEIRNLCEENSYKGKYHHFKICEGLLEWVQSTSDISQLEQYRNNGHFIKESELGTTYSQNNIQLIADDPGMGKSWIMKSLKNKFLTDMLAIILSPADMFEICKLFQKKNTDFSNFENLIIDQKYSKFKNFNQHVLKLLMQNGQVVYLWDALDEISFEQNLTIITKLIVRISENYSRHWITCRRNLRSSLESEFMVLSRTIIQFTEEQQTFYIQERLQSVCSKEDLKEEVIKIKNNVAFVNYTDVLSIPLQIYMLTELCLQNMEKYSILLSETFSITDLYQHFIEEKFNVYYNEKINVDEYTVKQLKQQEKINISQYEKAALNLIFESEFLERLHIGCDDIFTKQRGDCFGFITETGQFAHISYAEYFAARYFSKRKISKLSDVLFKEKYTNVRFFFDMLLAKNSPAHIAVLHKNLTELKKCSDQMLRNKDLGGRSPLHIACSLGERYPLLNFKTENLAERRPLSITFSWKKRYPVLKFNKKKINVFVLEDKVYYPAMKESVEYIQMLQYLLTKCDINETDKMFKMSPLSYARKCDCLFAIVNIRHQQKTDYFHSDNNFSLSILFYSVLFGFDESVKMFKNIKHIETQEGQTLLHLASENGHEEVVHLLIKSGFGVNVADKRGKTPLHLASYNGHDKVAILLIQFGGDIDVVDEFGATPLQIACRKGYSEVTKLLIKSGADINAADYSGRTALYWACNHGDDKIVALLIESGADTSTDDKTNVSPLQIACRKRYSRIIKLLIKSGVNIDVADFRDRTALYWACQRGNDKVAILLIDSGADVNVVNDYSESPLLMACQNKSYEVVKVLLKFGAILYNYKNPLFWACNAGDDKLAALFIEFGANINDANKDGWTPLQVACHNESYGVTKLLIKSGADLNAAGFYGRTPLHEASVHDDDKTAALLIECGANNNARDKYGCTPLHIACDNQSYELIKLLVKSGADINAADIYGMTPFHRACLTYTDDKVGVLLIDLGADINAAFGNVETLLQIAFQNKYYALTKLLIKSGADVNNPDSDDRYPLHWACNDGNDEVAALLIEFGANINAADKDGERPLHVACQNQSYEVTKLLIRSGAAINAAGFYGRTPLHEASIHYDDKIAALLIECGANINAKDKNGWTPLHVACDNQTYEVIKLLIKFGSDINAEDNDGTTPLHRAYSTYEDDQAAALLIELGADINAANSNGETLLQIACQNKSYELAKLLIKSGAYVNAPDSNDKCPLYWACNDGNAEVAALLIECGANINAADKDGETPLHVACQNGSYEVTKLLIKSEADINAVDKKGRTPLSWACGRKDDQIVALLTEIGAKITNSKNSHTFLDLEV